MTRDSRTGPGGDSVLLAGTDEGRGVMSEQDSREPTRLQHLMGQLTGTEKAAQAAKELQRQGVQMKTDEQVKTPAGKKPDWEAGNREQRRVLTEEQGTAVSPAGNRPVAAQPEQAPAREAAQTKPGETLEQVKAEAMRIVKEGVEKQQREATQKAKAPKQTPLEQHRGGRRR